MQMGSYFTKVAEAPVNVIETAVGVSEVAEVAEVAETKEETKEVAEVVTNNEETNKAVAKRRKRKHRRD
jgi:hypothetical protein